MNKVNLIGRTTKDIDLKYTQTQIAVARFTLAINRRKKDDGADFIPCTAWGKTAEIMDKYVKRGDRIGIAGRIQTGSYEKDGHKHYTTDVIVEDLELLESKKDGASKQQSNEPDFSTEGFTDIPDDFQNELPF